MFAIIHHRCCVIVSSRFAVADYFNARLPENYASHTPTRDDVEEEIFVLFAVRAHFNLIRARSQRSEIRALISVVSIWQDAKKKKKKKKFLFQKEV